MIKVSKAPFSIRPHAPRRTAKHENGVPLNSESLTGG